MTSTELIDEYVVASGDPKVTKSDLELLERYADLRVGNYCLPGCSACRESCPDGVRISEVLRTRMYDVDYGDRWLARSEYAALGSGAGACLTCAHQACLGTCPARVPIARFTREAAVQLA
jgi:predicted aldo/keto reductase-like oxidoreductase